MNHFFNNIYLEKTSCWRFIIFLLVIWPMSFNVWAIELQGQLKLVGKNAKKANITETVIYFKPNKPVPVKAFDKPHRIDMKNKSYRPRVSVVPVESDIQISNSDSILHNAFSPSKPNDFDLGLYTKSEGKIHTVKKPGVIRIFCNVHYHMVAYVLALDTPFYTYPDAQGLFYFDNLPEGEGRLIIWHERAKKIVKEVSLTDKMTIDLELPITKRRIPEHKNKSGKKYKKKKRRRKYR